jgi:beta-lactamase superfamily II metal-dependent hydrolase
VRFEFLHPAAELQKRNERTAELQIPVQRTEVLLVPHRGSRTSSSPELIAAVARPVPSSFERIWMALSRCVSESRTFR